MATAPAKTMPTIMDDKTIRLSKKARKTMRRIRKRAIKTSDTTTLAHVEHMIEIFDTILADQKTARKAAKVK